MERLHYILLCRNEASIEVVSKLIEFGGRYFMIGKESHYGSTTLHAACGNQASIDVVLMLIEIGRGRKKEF